MSFVEITILSMLFSHARGGGCQLGLKKICRPHAVVKIPDTPWMENNEMISSSIQNNDSSAQMPLGMRLPWQIKQSSPPQKTFAILLCAMESLLQEKSSSCLETSDKCTKELQNRCDRHIYQLEVISSLASLPNCT